MNHEEVVHMWNELSGADSWIERVLSRSNISRNFSGKSSYVGGNELLEIYY